MSLEKEFVEQQKETLLQEKKKIEEELKTFTAKDSKLAGDYDAKFPDYGRSESENAQEEEEYYSRVGREGLLETQLVKVNSALKNIEAGKYGLCEKCGSEIEKERLQAEPAAVTCLEHKSNR